MAIKFLSSGNVTGGLVVTKPASASVEIAKFEIDGTGGSFGSLSFVSIVPGSGNYATQLRLYTDNISAFHSLTNNGGQLELATNDNNPLVLKTNLTTRLTISATGAATFSGTLSSKDISIVQADDSGFDGGLTIRRSVNTQKVHIGMDGGAVNFNSPGGLSYKFRNNGTEKFTVDGSGNATFAGNVVIGKQTTTADQVSKLEFRGSNGSNEVQQLVIENDG